MIEQLRTVFDPEIPVNIYELGLIYEVKVDDAGQVGDPHDAHLARCARPPSSCRPRSRARRAASPASARVKLDLVWDPPWNPSMMSEAARLDLGMV